jgi:hypothetical protein
MGKVPDLSVSFDLSGKTRFGGFLLFCGFKFLHDLPSGSSGARGSLNIPRWRCAYRDYGLAILLFPVAIRVSPLHFPLTMLY